MTGTLGTAINCFSTAAIYEKIGVLVSVSNYFLQPGGGLPDMNKQIPALIQSFSQGGDYHPSYTGDCIRERVRSAWQRYQCSQLRYFYKHLGLDRAAAISQPSQTANWASGQFCHAKQPPSLLVRMGSTHSSTEWIELSAISCPPNLQHRRLSVSQRRFWRRLGRSHLQSVQAANLVYRNWPRPHQT